MQEKELSIGVANKIYRGFRTAKRSRLWRSTFLGSLMVAGLFIVLAPVRADNDKDMHPGREDNDRGIRAEITALQAQVAALQSSVSTLQDQVNTLKTANSDLENQINSLQTSSAKVQNQVNSLETSNTTLQKQLAAVQSNHALLLGPFVNVDPNPEIGVKGPNIIFSGANIHIVSGSGSTFDNDNARGLGNLIIGYDDDPQNLNAGMGGGAPLQPGDRGGSHNLVIGGGNRFTQSAFGGIVAGELNTISSFGATVAGGRINTASGQDASVNGGIFNTASGQFCTVNGGVRNIANGDAASVSGGLFNTAGGEATVVIGGQGVADNKNNSLAPQPPFP